ncbi:MAG: phospholipid/cholesterol/gamma-HCH transport system permease protein [Pseudonocardiales bacterium]|jgi:phospholipid/cholesterol/gamma-HCH transport system permease protein|uniref:MlaE family ABC transporter permease n=1 Tax=Pseudonocardia sp. TaxID=60912 RepID=UPI00261A7298|nr:ABC transporter permease [Pseudonocardia sp.]MCW2717503.1 transporter permease [Pseudonocardia sp.]MDT7618401.1 phospholipid/cholesterol/gamma-HCH transport system permease protein [Pseudonocardiales bacterium]MDT7705041.1 phospholipid/cholesterol/gamma-HCH transport system permease protein [Pseudonocardiales bacterium]
MTQQTVRRAGQIVALPGRVLDDLGRQLAFYGRAYGWAPVVVRRYSREIWRQLAAVSLGTGALALVGGTAVIVAFLTGTTGIEVALQGYSQLSNVGVEALSGFISAYLNTRIAAPLIAGVALIATVGAGFTAELGAMRISEEIDALDVMAIPAVPFLVTTRVIAGMIAITPLYAISLIMSYGLTRLTVVLLYGQSPGGYDHYFATFLVPADILSSLIEVLTMAVVIISVHCFYGFTAAGGPSGVGKAVGQAVRLSLISIMVVAMAMSLLLYGNSNTLHISR